MLLFAKANASVYPNGIYRVGICQLKKEVPTLALPEWAQRVVTLRRDLGLLQAEFAAKFGVKQSSVSRWESGSREPSVENYIRMGNLADEADCIWFWERAGVDMKRIERWISARKMPSKRPQNT
jgi:DNA-binding XRE family transcriptional regulator